jgi:dephospho-CoA kinase
MITIGVTGGIGSGKSVVCDIFRLHGIPVFDADKEAKALNDTSPVIREQLIRHFGEELYPEGKLDRKKLSALIFQDEHNLAIANAIIHPILAAYFLEWCRQRNNEACLVIEAAVLIESGFHRFTDKVITVCSPGDIRMERVMKRDSTDRKQVELRMKNQLPEEEKARLSDYVIYNDHHHSLIRQVADFLQSLTTSETSQ